MLRVLKETGSIYLHCDPTASHYLKTLMDAIFGWRNFRNEIIWHYQTSSGKPRRHFIKNTDTIFLYAKATKSVFNVIRAPWPDKTLRKWQRDDIGIYRTNNGKKFYINPLGKRIDNVWEITLSSRSMERTGYPTQKPLALLDRIIKASSNEGEVVLDPFAGCATACVAAERLGRQWVGIDISEKAAELVQVRIRKEIDLYHKFEPIRRSDVPHRTDLGKLPNYRTHKHLLFGKQEGCCGGCRVVFPFRNFTVDHKVPRSKGGIDHFDNLQLLCGACNSVKGDRDQAYLIANIKTLN